MIVSLVHKLFCSHSDRVLQVQAQRVALCLVLGSLPACSSLPSYDGPYTAARPATISGHGGVSTDPFCGMGSLFSTTPQICGVRVSIIDGKRTSVLSSEIDVDPGQHTLKILCSVALLTDMRYFANDLVVSVESGKSYHLDGRWEGYCAPFITDDQTEKVVSRPSGGVPITSQYGQQPAPAQSFSGILLDVRVPVGEGWHVISAKEPNFAFTRISSETGETYAANASLFQLHETATPQEFAETIKRSVQKDTPPERFTPRNVTYAYSEDRGYPCEKIDAVYEDRKAQTVAGQQTLLLQSSSIYCRHPAQKNLAFVASFSHRGTTLLPDLDAQAAPFLQGVQVSKK